MPSYETNPARRDLLAIGLAGTAAVALSTVSAQAQNAPSKPGPGPQAGAGSGEAGIVVSQEYGRTPHSGMAEQMKFLEPQPAVRM